MDSKREALVLLFKWRIISGQQRGDQSEARRIVINNQNPFKIVHAIWLRPEAHLTYTQDWTELDWTGQDMVNRQGRKGCAGNDSINASSSAWA